MKPPMATNAIMPPATPPAIAPVLDEDEPFVLVGEGVGVVVVVAVGDIVEEDGPVDEVELVEDVVVEEPEEPVPINAPGEISGASK